MTKQHKLIRSHGNLRPLTRYVDGKLAVELMGLEPTTSCMPCKRSSQLSYSPAKRAL